MFDVYVPDPPLQCRRCGHPLDGWQSKASECLLLIWKQGHRHPAGQGVDHPLSDDELRRFALPERERFPLYTLCNGCGSWTRATGFCEDGVWRRTFLGDHLASVIGPARPLGGRWRQCGACADAWQEDPDVIVSECPACNVLTSIQTDV